MQELSLDKIIFLCKNEKIIIEMKMTFVVRGRQEMTEIFYVEDNAQIAGIVKEYLEQKAYHVLVFSTLAQVKEALLCHLPDMLLVDLNLPDGEGDSLCRWIRLKWSRLPVIFLTVRSDTKDIVSGFQNGADDYIVKPFELEILHSRIRALLRRAGGGQENYLSCGSILVDREKMAVYFKGEEVCVSHVEYKLLLLLMENKGKTLTRERLLEQIWDSNGNYVNDNTLTVAMKRLREKLHAPSCIKTVRSFGYRMEEEE